MLDPEWKMGEVRRIGQSTDVTLLYLFRKFSSIFEESYELLKSELILYGMKYSNHDFSSLKSGGKNIFTNAFPLSLAQYMAQEKDLNIPLITSRLDENQDLAIEHVMTPWSNILGVGEGIARFDFEKVFEGYRQLTHSIPNKSDVVVTDAKDLSHKRPFEIKLVVTPTSSTAARPRELQSCELVVRPSSIEQLVFSIAHSYGLSRRGELQDIINEALGYPGDYKWSDVDYMRDRVPRFVSAAEEIIRRGIISQTPLLMTALWRTQGQTPQLEDDAFDIFVWSDLSFLQLFTRNVKSEKASGEMSRPARSLIWLVASLYEYCNQQSVNFGNIKSRSSFSVQTDKAGSFQGESMLYFLRSPQFYQPRVSRLEIPQIVLPRAREALKPERRLDQVLMLESTQLRIAELEKKNERLQQALSALAPGIDWHHPNFDAVIEGPVVSDGHLRLAEGSTRMPGQGLNITRQDCKSGSQDEF